MSDLIRSIALPLPEVNVAIRPGTLDDVPFLDALQKKTTKQVGWMPTKQFEGKIAAGHVLIAERGTADYADFADLKKESSAQSAESAVASRVGYLIGNDQYFKRDDVGIIYQINVVPELRRSLVAASLLKAQFERSAYGCRLYCCWCAQDIEANRFWEAMGFVPLAYRAGSLTRGKCGAAGDESGDSARRSSLSTHRSPRVHIFWQKRIRQNDTTTPWWFPSKTAGGSIREDRIVLPIPPGTHWSDAKPLILPGEASQKELDHEGTKDAKGDAKKDKSKKNSFVNASCPSSLRGEEKPVRRNGLMFDIPKQGEPLPEAPPKKTATPKPQKIKRVCDPRLVAAARELKDRYLEQINDGSIAATPKYEVSRGIETTQAEPIRLLAA